MDYASPSRADVYAQKTQSTIGNSSSAGTPLDDFDQMMASLTDRIAQVSSRIGNRADRLFGYRGDVTGCDTAAKPSSLSEALAILNGAVTDLEVQINRFYQ